MSKDYYNILEVEKTASQDEIKKAFRKKAHKYHPDKQGGDEAKFKEANEAYQVLGKAEKRKQYDQFGATFDQQGGFGGGMNWDDFMSQARGGGFQGGADFGVDLGDILGDLFGFGGGGSRRRQNYRGRDIEIIMNLEFREAVFGIEKEINLNKQVKCDHCHGNGAEPGTKITNCSVCGGSGQVKRVQQTILGAFQSVSTCRACGGEGKKAEKLCSKCSGNGVYEAKKGLKINIPAGVRDREVLKMSGEGEAGLKGSPSGDLYINIRVKEDPQFKRDNDNIKTKESISFSQAALGDKIEVETLDGPVKLKIPEGSQTGKVFKLTGKGVPHLHRRGRGDHLVKVIVQTPQKLSKKQKELLRKL